VDWRLAQSWNEEAILDRRRRRHNRHEELIESGTDRDSDCRNAVVAILSAQLSRMRTRMRMLGGESEQGEEESRGSWEIRSKWEQWEGMARRRLLAGRQCVSTGQAQGEGKPLGRGAGACSATATPLREVGGRDGRSEEGRNGTGARCRQGHEAAKPIYSLA
jgi:hypothetical protein